MVFLSHFHTSKITKGKVNQVVGKSREDFPSMNTLKEERKSWTTLQNEVDWQKKWG